MPAEQHLSWTAAVHVHDGRPPTLPVGTLEQLAVRFDAVAGMLGLKERLHHKPSELSGGEQQRVALARAIISEPKIVLADEPTGNLDTKSSEAVLTLLRQLNKDLGQTIVMITHNPDAAAYRDRVLHMRDGMVVNGSAAHP